MLAEEENRAESKGWRSPRRNSMREKEAYVFQTNELQGMFKLKYNKIIKKLEMSKI